MNNIVKIACDYEHAMALDSSGNLWAWGSNSSGQLGTGDNINQIIPVQVQAPNSIKNIDCGKYHSVALDSPGNVWSWGRNDKGELGIGTLTSSYLPVVIPSLSNIVEIAAGGEHSVALDSLGNIYTWGCNTHGALGDNTNVDKYTPVAIFNNQDCSNIITMSENLNTNEVLIYPNPVKGKLFIKYLQIKRVEITDSRGCLLKTVNCDNETKVTIDLSNYNKGLYIINIIAENNTIVKKIIKQ